MSNDKQAKLFTETGSPLYTSSQVAGMLGKNRTWLILFISRREGLRPARRIGQDLFWTEGEIAAVTQAKATMKLGRPATK